MRIFKVVLCLFMLSIELLFSSSCRNDEPAISEIIELEPDFVIDGNADLNRLFAPGGILIGSDGRIFIVDPVSMRVLAYDSTGQYLFEFGRPGEGPGEFTWLHLNCDIDYNDDIYLVNQLRWIEVFDSNGAYLERISPDIEHIYDFAVHDSNSIFINAVALINWDDYHPVIEIDRTGEIVDFFGYIAIDTENMPRWKKYGISSCAIDVDDEGCIYYTSLVDYRIFKYDPDGNLVFTVEGSTPFEARYERQPPHGMHTLFFCRKGPLC